jgi:hypothetical protein
MGFLFLPLLLTAADPVDDDRLAKKMLPIYVKEAEEYGLTVESNPKNELELKKEIEGKLRWEYACGRYSDRELRVLRKDTEVFSSIPSETNPFAFGPLQLYRIYADKVFTTEGKLLARIQQNPSRPDGKHPGGKLILVEDK